MTDVALILEFDDHPGLYSPGEEIAAEYRVDTDDPQEVKSVEVSILWHTLGKGEEDLAVHHFERHHWEQTDEFDIVKPRRFRTRLPESPLSYDGRIVKICWCVRLRVFLRNGQEVVEEQPFQLGEVPRPPKIQPQATEW